jgi:hypothetical protein
MLCRLVGRSNADLQRVIDRMVGFDDIVPASTAIVMESGAAPDRSTGAPGVAAGAVWTADRWRTGLEGGTEK